MDCSKPLRRLLPVGIVSVAGLAGCASAPAYRPTMNSQAPPRPAAATDSSAAGTPAANGSAPAAPGSTETPALPAPITVPPAAPPAAAAPAPTDSAPSAAPGHVSNAPEVEPFLNAPMGVLQTPLPVPPASSAPAAAPPVDGTQPADAPQIPTQSAAPGQPSASVKVDVGATASATTTPKTNAAKKSKPAKPAEPPMSPLARLRARFHAITHSSSKPAPKREADETTKHETHLVTGNRTPLPMADVTVKVQAPPIHGLYAADDAEKTPGPPPAGDIQTARVDASTQPPLMQLPASTSATTQSAETQTSVMPAPPAEPVAASTRGIPTGNKAEQWPYSPGAATHSQAAAAAPATAAAASNESADDFTAIPVEEYRATVAKIERSNAPATSPSPSESAPPPSAWPGAAQSTKRDVPRTNAGTLGAAPRSVPGEAGAMMVIPQAVPRRDQLVQPAPIGPMAPGLPVSSRAVESLRDLATGAPASAVWSPPAASGSTITSPERADGADHGGS